MGYSKFEISLGQPSKAAEKIIECMRLEFKREIGVRERFLSCDPEIIIIFGFVMIISIFYVFTVCQAFY